MKANGDPQQHILGNSHQENGVFFDALTATVTELRYNLENGTLTSVDIVRTYYNQILKHDKQGLKLNAMLSLRSLAALEEEAQKLDDERANGNVRSLLHGVPILVKDSIVTHESLGLDTTCGSRALIGAKGAREAPIVTKLLKAGLIILGKTNLSEFAGCKGMNVTAGWSAAGGQTQSPYIRGGVVATDKFLGHSTPMGSSSGNAVGVAAGFAPLAIGTETDGSIVQPADRASIYAMKVTVGRLPTQGTFPWCRATDSLGPMAKTPEDLASLLGIMMEQDYTSALQHSWLGLRVGIVDPKLWLTNTAVCDHVESFVQDMFRGIDQAKEEMKTKGAKVVDVDLPHYEDFEHEGQEILLQLWQYDFAREIGNFLQFYKSTDIHTLQDVVAFNKANAAEALPPNQPSQSFLEDALSESDLSPDQYDKLQQILRNKAYTDGVERLLKEHQLDVILGPSTGRIASVAAAAGCPIGAVPLTYAKYNGRPFGMLVLAGQGQEEKILRLMSAWSTSFKREIAPQLLEAL